MYSLKSIANSAYSYIKNADVKNTLEEQDVLKLVRLAVEEGSYALQASGELSAQQAEEYTAAAMAGLSAGETGLSDDITGIMHLIRISGILPYYTCKAIACYFGAKILDKEVNEVGAFIAKNGIKEAVRRYCGFTFEAEVVHLISKQFAAILDEGRLAEDYDKVEIIKQAYKSGYHYEKTCRGCAQCTLAALFDLTGKKDEVLFRASNGFAAGMGLFGDGACGGYAGGLLFLGTYAGRRIEFFDGDKEQKDLNAKLAEKLHTRFIETYGTVTCQDIHKDIFGRAFHIRGAEDKEAFEAAGAHSLDKCTSVVATSSQWVAEILLEENLI